MIEIIVQILSFTLIFIVGAVSLAVIVFISSILVGFVKLLKKQVIDGQAQDKGDR